MLQGKTRVAILGASKNPERFSYRALKFLRSHGFDVVGISPRETEIDGMKCFKNLNALIESHEPIHTLTMYVNREISTSLQDEILRLHPSRIIFNPGTENPALAQACAQIGIEVVVDCTLVMLNLNRF